MVIGKRLGNSVNLLLQHMTKEETVNTFLHIFIRLYFHTLYNIIHTLYNIITLVYFTFLVDVVIPFPWKPELCIVRFTHATTYE